MKRTSSTENAVLRVKLIIPTYIRDKQLPELMAHIEDVVTTIDGLYTQLALVLIEEVQEAYIYEEAALSFLEEYYYTAVDKISRDKDADERSIVTYDQYPFTSLVNPLLEFNRIILLKYPNSPRPLTLSAIKMGSIVIDLLGIGKILDFIEHIIKQLQWESKHDREMADSGKRTAFLEEQLLNQKLIASIVDNEEKKLKISSVVRVVCRLESSSSGLCKNSTRVHPRAGYHLRQCPRNRTRLQLRKRRVFIFPKNQSASHKTILHSLSPTL